MKKKIFIQISLILYSIFALLLTIIAGSLYYVIEFIRSYIIIADIMEWIGFITAIIAIILITYLFIRLIRNRIVLEKKIFLFLHIGVKISIKHSIRQ